MDAQNYLDVVSRYSVYAHLKDKMMYSQCCACGLHIRAGVQDYELWKTRLGVDTPYRTACFLNCHECGTEHALLWRSDEHSPLFLKRREPNITDIAPRLLERHLIRQTRTLKAKIQEYVMEDSYYRSWKLKRQKLSTHSHINLLPKKQGWKNTYQSFQENILPISILLVFLPCILISYTSFYLRSYFYWYWARYTPAEKARARRSEDERRRECIRLTEQLHKHLQAQLDDLATEWDTLALPDFSIPPPEQLFQPILKPQWSYVGATLDHEPSPPRSVNPISQLSCAVCSSSMALLPEIDEDMPCPRCKAYALVTVVMGL